MITYGGPDLDLGFDLEFLLRFRCSLFVLHLDHHLVLRPSILFADVHRLHAGLHPDVHRLPLRDRDHDLDTQPVDAVPGPTQEVSIVGPLVSTWTIERSSR